MQTPQGIIDKEQSLGEGSGGGGGGGLKGESSFKYLHFKVKFNVTENMSVLQPCHDDLASDVFRQLCCLKCSACSYKLLWIWFYNLRTHIQCPKIGTPLSKVNQPKLALLGLFLFLVMKHFERHCKNAWKNAYLIEHLWMDQTTLLRT